MWATVPALILIGLFGITVSRLGDLSQIPTDPNTLHISVTGKQFQWEFAYGSSGVKSNDLHIPVGTPLVFDVTSTDVIHSFWVPDLYGKIDANPGRVNRITFRANKPGEYRGVCAELCGAGHGAMLFRVEAVTQGEFQQWLQQQQAAPGAPGAVAPAPQPNAGAAASAVPSPAAVPKPAAPPAAGASPVASPAAPAPAPAPQPAAPAGGADPAAGAALIQQKGCGGCHTIPGIAGANGNIGPNLAGVASRTNIAGGAVPNN